MNTEASLDKAFTANCHTGILIWTCYQGLSNIREVLITVIFSWPCLVRDVVSQYLSILFLFNRGIDTQLEAASYNSKKLVFWRDFLSLQMEPTIIQSKFWSDLLNFLEQLFSDVRVTIQMSAFYHCWPFRRLIQLHVLIYFCRSKWKQFGGTITEIFFPSSI